MGHALSERGIVPADEKFKAVYDAREQSNVAKVRSFLGLVNFCAHFIPNLKTTAKPLRRLTHQGTVFQWVFQLKERLSKVETLA